jgi:hypothetical protein
MSAVERGSVSNVGRRGDPLIEVRTSISRST